LGPYVLEEEEAASGLQDPKDLAGRGLGIGERAEDEEGHRRVEGVVPEGQGLGGADLVGEAIGPVFTIICGLLGYDGPPQ
jgi:hypothetical protein